MTLVFEKYRSITSPALAPTQPREAYEFDQPQFAADDILTIGLVNNMPDPALQATERQFMRLLQAAAGQRLVRLHCFSLPSVKRSATALQRVERHYADLADIDRLRIDGLIVTGAEPQAATLRQEPFWQDLADIVDWARTHTRSTIWSCLAAHAAVLHLDGIARHRLDQKCSGVYDCATSGGHWLTDHLPASIRVPHSRLNEVRGDELMARGYRLLTASPQVGVDIFTKQLHSQFIFFQGHPEYDATSLQREYQRDLARYLAGERDSYPGMPYGYFDADTEHRLAEFEARARRARQPALAAELGDLRLRGDVAKGGAASVIFRSWIRYLSETARAVAAR